MRPILPHLLPKKTQYVCVCVSSIKSYEKIRVVFVSCPLCCLFCLAVTQRTKKWTADGGVDSGGDTGLIEVNSILKNAFSLSPSSKT